MPKGITCKVLLENVFFTIDKQSTQPACIMYIYTHKSSKRFQCGLNLLQLNSDDIET